MFNQTFLPSTNVSVMGIRATHVQASPPQMMARRTEKNR